MEIRIGLKHTPRELTFDSDASAEDVRSSIEEAINKDRALITFSDTRGREFLVDTESIAYVELGTDSGRRIGFVS